MFRTLYKAPIVLLLISLPVIAQTSQPAIVQSSEASKTGSITGRVVNESGQPLPNARISVQPADGVSLLDGGAVQLTRPARRVSPSQLAAGPRVGVTGEHDRPWRFWLDGDPTVSVYRRHVPKTR